MPKVYVRGDTLRISQREVDSFSQTTRKCINIEMENFRRE
jgi:pyridoxine 5'-phosphate synthase PdxJ